MALNFTELDKSIAEFNKKYGVNFNINSFDLKSRTMGDINNKEESMMAMNAAYRTTFIKLHKAALNNFIDKKIPEFNSNQMLKDFEQNIMSGYRDICKKENVSTPAVDGGWSRKDFAERIYKEVKDLPKSKVEHARRRYVNGELSIDDMKAYTKDMETNRGYSKQPLSTVLCYIYALENAISSRSFFWKAFHPFRSRAEKAELRELKDIVLVSTGTTGHLDGATNEYLDAEAVADENTIEKIKKEINTSLVQSKLEEEKTTKVGSEKESISVAEASNNNSKEINAQKIEKNPELSKNILTTK